MSGVYGEFGAVVDEGLAERLSTILDPHGAGGVETLRCDAGLLAAGFPASSGAARRIYDDGRFAGVLGGDIAAGGGVPWESMIAPLRDGEPRRFPELSGLFAAVLHDRRTGRVFVVSDPFCFYPVFYRIAVGRVFVSSHPGAFAAGDPAPEFNPGWLYELLYYSFPVGSTGMWKDVFRAPPATVTEIDPAAGSVAFHRYGGVYRQAERPLSGKQALERAVEVFKTVMPRYYGDPGAVAHALTAGWDCRALAGLIPAGALDRVASYTYGLPGSNDLVEARRIAAGLGLPHREIHFDEKYVALLPLLALETVFQAGGLENVNRAYIPYVYHEVTAGGSEFPYVISGIGADALFRGHVPTPNGLSYDMDAAFRTGRRTVNEAFFREVFGARYGAFRAYIDGSLDWFERTYNGFGSVQSYFAYEIFEGLPRYFNGECMIADHCSSLRIPYLDPAVVRLACEIEYSVMKLWRFINEDIYRETYVQSALIETNPRLRAVPINGVPVRAFSCRNKTLYQLTRIACRGPRKLVSLALGSRRPPLEDWDGWYRTVLGETFEELLGPEARVRRYLDGRGLERIRGERELHWLKLAAQAEIVMRLAENGWKRFWDNPLGR